MKPTTIEDILWNFLVGSLLVHHSVINKSKAITDAQTKATQSLKDLFLTEEEMVKIIEDAQNIPVHNALDGMMAMDYMKKKIASALYQARLKKAGIK